MAHRFLRRSSTLACFFCLSSPAPAPPNPRSFRCPHCGCWNRYDANGEIMSDEPAMHDEKMNASSFAKRASPNKDRLPSTYGKGPFCHTCQTNQMLLVNLLSNYLPPPQHPDYARRLEQLPAYRDSLHVRYPPVCANCLPAVEDEIEQKNHMARTKALGGWLKDSRGKGRQRLASGSGGDHERLGFQLALWRARGALWWTTLLCVVITHAAAIRGYDFSPSLARVIPALPLLSLFSLFYTAWDPTYYRFKKAKVQGRDVRIKGKTGYIILQMLSWFSRLTTSILLVLPRQSSSLDYLRIVAYPLSHRVTIYCSILLTLELLVFSSSFTILHLQRPPTIRLVGASTRSSSVRDTPELSTYSPRASESPMPIATTDNEPDHFASLTLSSKPLISATNPMFGHPSLVPSTPPPPINVDEGPDEDAMDWTPTNPSPVKAKKAVDDDGVWLRPQRFFPPECPTGLENLFANTKLDDGATKPNGPVQKDFWNMGNFGCWITPIVVLLISLGTVVYHRWTKEWIQ